MVCIRYALAVLLFLALIFDIKTDKVPNALVLCGYLTGMVNLMLCYGCFGILRCVLIIAAVWLCFMPAYILKGLGGGDCKILAWPALFLEPELWLKCYFLIFLCGGVIALYKLFVVKKRMFHFTAAELLGIVLLFTLEALI